MTQPQPRTPRHTRCAMLLCLLCVLVGVRAQEPNGHRPPPPTARVVELDLHDTLQPASAALLHRSLRDADRMQATVFLLNLSTPGGLASSADVMVRDIRASRVPVIVFAGTPRTRISGEGLRLMAAADVAAISPYSYLTPLWTEVARGVRAQQRADESGMLAESLARLQEAHGRSAAHVDALASGTHWIASDEAVRDHIVDLEAVDESQLLQRLNGRTLVPSNGTAVTLDFARPDIQRIYPKTSEAVASALMNPDLAVLLLTLGGLLIYLEVNTPGIIIPGAAGLLLVLLSASALHRLPLRTSSVILMIVATALTLLEARLRRHRLIAVLGIAFLTVGLATLVRGPIPELEVGWGTAAGAGIGFGGITAVLIVLGVEARRAKIKTGADAMLGWLAVTYTPLTPEGEILVRGELWHARLVNQDASLPAGERVKVLRADGHTLEVSAVPAPVAV